jgi:DNA-binding transcriptional LysR family regulator
MDLEGLRSFIAISREKSISKAALSLHITQPTLSIRIRKLEEGLGVKLLERSWDGVKLTIQGHYFLTYAIQLLQIFSDATTVLTAQNERSYEHLAEAVNVKRLHIGIETFLIPSYIKPLMDVLRTCYPGLECRITTNNSQFLYNSIDNGMIHLGLVFNKEEKPDIRSIPLTEDQTILIYPESYGFDINQDFSKKRLLKDKPFMLFDPSLVNFRKETEDIFLELFGAIPERFHIVDNIEVAMEMIAQGFGYTVTTGFGVAAVLNNYPAIRCVRLGEGFPRLRARLVYKDIDTAPIPLKPLIEQLASAFTNERQIHGYREQA